MTCFLHRREFSLSKPSCQQLNNRVWTGGKKADVKPVFSLSVRSLRSMWWSRLACVLVARDDSTLLTRALKCILRTTLAVSFPVLSTTALDCCPVDTSSSTHSSCHAELAPNQLPRFHCQRPVVSEFTRLEPLGLPCLGQCWRPITSAIRNRKRSPNWRKSCRWSRTANLSDQ